MIYKQRATKILTNKATVGTKSLEQEPMREILIYANEPAERRRKVGEAAEHRPVRGIVSILKSELSKM